MAGVFSRIHNPSTPYLKWKILLEGGVQENNEEELILSRKENIAWTRIKDFARSVYALPCLDLMLAETKLQNGCS